MLSGRGDGASHATHKVFQYNCKRLRSGVVCSSTAYFSGGALRLALIPSVLPAASFHSSGFVLLVARVGQAAGSSGRPQTITPSHNGPPTEGQP